MIDEMFCVERDALEHCNIPNFGPNTYRHEPIDYDVILMFILIYWVEDATAYEHHALFYTLCISQL